MTLKAFTQSVPRRLSGSGFAAAGLLFAAACSTEVNDPGGMGGPVAGASGNGTAGGGPTAGSGGGGVVDGPPGCAPASLPPRRVVRTTFTQHANMIRSLIGEAAAQPIIDASEVLLPEDRIFPPLAHPSEQSIVNERNFDTGDRMSAAVAKHVFDNFATVTGCGAAPTDECAKQYLGTFAEKAYRRALDQAEKDSLNLAYDTAKAAPPTGAGATIQEATQVGVHGILLGPGFTYRTELGSAAAAETPLTAFELASVLSFFIVDGPPDQPLLDAARSNALGTPEQIMPHVDRLLGTAVGKRNLETATFAYFGLNGLNNVVIDPVTFPSLTLGVLNAMYREGDEFLKRVLYNQPLPELITSRTSMINTDLANLYGVANFPSTDPNVFQEVQLPEVRAGLLTMGGFLTSRARPDTESVVARGLLVNRALLCFRNPTFPDNMADAVAQFSMDNANATEKQKVDLRAMRVECASCHLNFDAYGLALDNFDIIGRYRTVDSGNRPIESAATLPAIAGGKTVTGAAAMAAELASNGAFIACMASNFLEFALAEANLAVNGCDVQGIADNFKKGSDPTFKGLIRQIAVSKSLAVRSGGTP